MQTAIAVHFLIVIYFTVPHSILQFRAPWQYHFRSREGILGRYGQYCNHTIILNHLVGKSSWTSPYYRMLLCLPTRFAPEILTKMPMIRILSVIKRDTSHRTDRPRRYFVSWLAQTHWCRHRRVGPLREENADSIPEAVRSCSEDSFYSHNARVEMDWTSLEEGTFRVRQKLGEMKARWRSNHICDTSTRFIRTLQRVLGIFVQRGFCWRRVCGGILDLCLPPQKYCPKRRIYYLWGNNQKNLDTSVLVPAYSIIQSFYSVSIVCISIVITPFLIHLSTLWSNYYSIRTSHSDRNHGSNRIYPLKISNTPACLPVKLNVAGNTARWPDLSICFALDINCDTVEGNPCVIGWCVNSNNSKYVPPNKSFTGCSDTDFFCLLN